MAAKTPEWPQHYWTVADAWALVARCREGLSPEDLQPSAAGRAGAAEADAHRWREEAPSLPSSGGPAPSSRPGPPELAAAGSPGAVYEAGGRR